MCLKKSKSSGTVLKNEIKNSELFVKWMRCPRREDVTVL